MDQNVVCQIHQQPFVSLDDKSQQCLICQTSKSQSMYESDAKNFQNQIDQNEQRLELLKQFCVGLEYQKQQILQKIDKLFISLSLFIKTIEERQTVLKDQFYNQYQPSFQTEQVEQKNFQTIMQEAVNQLSIGINALQVVSKIDVLFNLLKNFNINIEKDRTHLDTFSTQLSLISDQKFDYQLLEQLSYKQSDYCFAVAFNKDVSIVIAGCERLIKVFEFNQEEVKEIQQLNNHLGRVYCLLFMKSSNHFISASNDGVMIIWKQNQQSLWESQFELIGHVSPIYTITLNLNDDMLISGSDDKKIIIWKRVNDAWRSQQQISCSDVVYSISLSTDEDKFIASIEDKQILIIKFQGTEWMIIQKIKVKQYGYRLCFINQNQFVFQPYGKQFLQIFDYDQEGFKLGETLKYLNTAISDDALFPIFYISSIGLILVKSDEYIHLIKRTQNGSLKVERSIHVGQKLLYGGVCFDGRYIATWDYDSKEIQIRKLRE